jgi:hypothetical protein
VVAVADMLPGAVEGWFTVTVVLAQAVVLQLPAAFTK